MLPVPAFDPPFFCCHLFSVFKYVHLSFRAPCRPYRLLEPLLPRLNPWRIMPLTNFQAVPEENRHRLQRHSLRKQPDRKRVPQLMSVEFNAGDLSQPFERPLPIAKRSLYQPVSAPEKILPVELFKFFYD